MLHARRRKEKENEGVMVNYFLDEIQRRCCNVVVVVGLSIRDCVSKARVVVVLQSVQIRVGRFRFYFYLCFKTSPGATPFILK